MDILFRKGRATAAEVQGALDEPVSNSGVRGMLRYLAAKGYVTHEQDGPRYVYSPAAEVEEVSRSALRHLVSTFFRNSPSSAIAAVLDIADTKLSEEEFQRLSRLLEQAREPEGGE
jgi:predicted transcriptional regulator